MSNLSEREILHKTLIAEEIMTPVPKMHIPINKEPISATNAISKSSGAERYGPLPRLNKRAKKTYIPARIIIMADISET